MASTGKKGNRMPRVFGVMLFATVFWSFTALATTGELPAIVSLGGYPLLLIAWFGEKRYPVNKWIWRLLIVVVILFVGWFFQTRARTEAVIYLLLFLLVNKLWTPKKPRDILQIYIISFFFMLSAAILTMSMAYMLFFIGYVLLLVSGLGFLTVRREHELLASLGGDKQSGVNPEQTIPTELYLRAGGLALIVFFFTFLVFMLFPRFSEQRFLTGLTPLEASARTGFTTGIQLGAASRIEADPTVVMRVILSYRANTQPLEHLYLRGGVLEHYTNGNWSENPAVHERERIWLPPNEWVPLLTRIPPGDMKEVRQTIYLSSSEQGNLFMLENGTRMILSAGQFSSVLNDEESNTLRLLNRSRKPITYTVTSMVRTEEPLAAAGFRRPLAVGNSHTTNAGAAISSITRAFRTSLSAGLRSSAHAVQRLNKQATLGQVYTQLPESPNGQRIAALAEEIIQNSGARSDSEIARAFETYLQRNFRYATENLNFRGGDPTELFLLQYKRGHCEYFASAMALLLRYAGVPSRVVNGYYTDRWNNMGEYFQVEKADAHSWVEANIKELGWVAFDPSPPANIIREPSTKGLHYKLRIFTDAVKMKWRLYVIDYDIDDQVNLIGGLSRSAPTVFGPFGNLISRGTSSLGGERTARELAGRTILGIALIITAVVIGGSSIAISRWTVKRRARLRTTKAALQRRRIFLYERIVKILEKRILVRKASQTPLEFARRVALLRPELSGFATLTRQYYQFRYDDRQMTVDELSQFEEFYKYLRDIF